MKIITLLFSSFLLLASSFAVEKQPNIVFLLIDDLGGFLTRPIAIVLILLAIASLVWPVVRDARNKRRPVAAEGLVE